MKTILKNSKNTKGFSLLEILIAVAILATSFTVLLTSQGSSYLSSERAEQITQATFLARQKMSDIEIELAKDLEKNKFPDQEKEEVGIFDEPLDEFRWKYSVRKVEIPIVGTGNEESGNPLIGAYMKNMMEQISKSIREIKVTIFWGDKDSKEEDQPQMSVTTHIVKL